jgi:hypothetical protein
MVSLLSPEAIREAARFEMLFSSASAISSSAPTTLAVPEGSRRDVGFCPNAA